MRVAVGSEHRTRVDHAAVAELARAVPGRWVPAGAYASLVTADGAARRIPRALRMRFYEPAGAFEAYAHTTVDGPVVWVRCTEGGPHPALPARMLVRIPVPGQEPGDVTVTPVSIPARCRTCGGPRGWDRVHAYLMGFGTREYEVDRWSNLCGHPDAYADVLEEARRAPGRTTAAAGRDGGHHRPNPVRAGVFRTAVELVLQAADEDPHTRARQAVALLRLHGHQEAARLLEDRVLINGHMSARQAAHILTSEGAARRTSTSTTRQEANA